MADKVQETLLEALKAALMEPGEQRLFRSGKLEGLFHTRTGGSGEAAALALQQDLVEVVRTDTKGKTTIEWVRLTPRGVEYVHEHESPVGALQDLQRALQVSREALPGWLAQQQAELQRLSKRLVESAQQWTHRLNALSQRVEEALRRADAGKPSLSNGVATIVPWALDALVYLDHRQSNGAVGNCPLPELFGALRQQHAELTITAFHDGLRRLFDRRALHLLPYTGESSELPEPEYALLDGSAILYYAAR